MIAIFWWLFKLASDYSYAGNDDDRYVLMSTHTFTNDLSYVLEMIFGWLFICANDDLYVVTVTRLCDFSYLFMMIHT